MSETAAPSSMLDGLIVGQPISEHNGVTCCPAIRESDGKQFFVKTLSIPASPVQASALLLSGAYETPDQVKEYFRTLADAIDQEAQLHCDLQTRGFLPYTTWEVTEAEAGIGFEICLLQPCRESICQRPWTHREALQLALNLCEALNACREKGMLYADLKPENIYRSDIGRYCIGDLGMLPLASLSYTTLPVKYRSAYTAPEMVDDYATVSSNADVYALGAILSEIYNGYAPMEAGTVPQYADYELCRILSTACHIDPVQRYADPAAMATAIETYLATFGTSDDPVIYTPVTQAPDDESDTLFLTEEENDAMLKDLLLLIPDEEPPIQVLDALLTQNDDEDSMVQMLAQADELINHQLPQPVVAPAVIDVTLPVLPTEPEPAPAPEQPELPQIDQPAETEVQQPPAEEPLPEDEPSEPAPDEEVWDTPPKPKTKKTLIVLTVIAAVLALLIGGAVYYYQSVYTLHIDNLTLDVATDRVTVIIDSDISDDLLKVVCSTAYGTTNSYNVVDGQVIITDLTQNTTYQISVQIIGNHRLEGKTNDIFTTPSITSVSDLNVISEVWAGSVKVIFVTNATANTTWILRYTADGEAEKTISFTGTEVMLTGLTRDKAYTFTLELASGSSISGQTEIQYYVH